MIHWLACPLWAGWGVLAPSSFGASHWQSFWPCGGLLLPETRPSGHISLLLPLPVKPSPTCHWLETSCWRFGPTSGFWACQALGSGVFMPVLDEQVGEPRPAFYSGFQSRHPIWSRQGLFRLSTASLDCFLLWPATWSFSVSFLGWLFWRTQNGNPN